MGRRGGGAETPFARRTDACELGEVVSGWSRAWLVHLETNGLKPNGLRSTELFKMVEESQALSTQVVRSASPNGETRREGGRRGRQRRSLTRRRRRPRREMPNAFAFGFHAGSSSRRERLVGGNGEGGLTRGSSARQERGSWVAWPIGVKKTRRFWGESAPLPCPPSERTWGRRGNLGHGRRLLGSLLELVRSLPHGCCCLCNPVVGVQAP